MALAGVNGMRGRTGGQRERTERRARSAMAAIRTTSADQTDAIRYNTDQGLWQQRTLKFDAALLKAGENTMTFTVPAGDLQSGVVWDYLRLELDESAKLASGGAPRAGQ